MNFNHSVIVEQYTAFSYACWSVTIFFGLCSLVISMMIIYQFVKSLVGLFKRDNPGVVDNGLYVEEKLKTGLSEPPSLPIVSVSGRKGADQ